MRIGIVGGGMMGICIGYFLSKEGVEVEIFETSPTVGGLAGSIALDDGTTIDRFYHAILSSDDHLVQICQELGIADQLRFHETKMGFHYQGKIHSMNNIVEFLRFPPLGWVDRFRLGLTVLYAQLIRNWQSLERISLERWLVQVSGPRTFKNIWLPMLNAKFDGTFENTPATYIWARLVRMKSTRSGVRQREKAGHLIGGYSLMIRTMAKRIEDQGGKIHLQMPIEKIVVERNGARGLIVDREYRCFDRIISTMELPIFRHLIPEANSDYQNFLAESKYLGIICPVLALDRPLTGFWTLNLTDDRIPFTGVIETTSYIDPHYVGDHHLVYLPKYTAPDSPMQNLTDEQVKTIWLNQLESMFPSFDRSWIHYFLVQRTRYVEPIHPLNGMDTIPSVHTPIKNLYLATNAQIYPGLTNGESISRKAREVAELILGEIRSDIQIDRGSGNNHE